MVLDFNCCPNFSLGSLCICKNKEKSFETKKISKDEPIVLVHNDPIYFTDIIPRHNNFLYLKILEDKKILTIAGDLIYELNMKEKDLKNKNICEIEKNTELFGEFICPLVDSSIKEEIEFQFFFQIGKNIRLFCCSVYTCKASGKILSIDCVIRPVTAGLVPTTVKQFELVPQELDTVKTVV